MKNLLRLWILSTVLASTTLVAEDYVTADDPWYRDGVVALNERLALIPNTNRAKNVILFVADGMGVSTITAARIFDGQSRGEMGEENVLSFERFPHSALVKTYNTDAQVADSAGTASALNTGVKTNIGSISTHHSETPESCDAVLDGYPATLAELAKADGRSIGVISTTLIVDATPSAVYAHSPRRGWMSNNRMPGEAIEAGCTDIASQMLAFSPNVALGGGRVMFIPNSLADPEDGETMGQRTDERDLTKEWLTNNKNAAYVWNTEGFAAVDTSTTDHFLGLFEAGNMQFEVDRIDDIGGEPSLTDMTKVAIEILSRNNDGFYLMVEGGRVDHGHHAGNAYRALTDAQEFAEAVAAAVEMVDMSETLILVTADHSHTFTIAGYPERGNPILGLSGQKNPGVEGGFEPRLAGDGKPYTTLGYTNGSGAIEGKRPILTQEEVLDPNYKQQSAIPMGSETHAGEDVAVFAVGPWAHLVDGVMEQNLIFHIMKHAMELEE